MSNGCIGCTQQIIEANAKEKEILKLAAQRAKETGEDFAFYYDGEGQPCIIPASASAGYPVRLYITPQYQDTAV